MILALILLGLALLFLLAAVLLFRSLNRNPYATQMYDAYRTTLGWHTLYHLRPDGTHVDFHHCPEELCQRARKMEKEFNLSKEANR